MQCQHQMARYKLNLRAAFYTFFFLYIKASFIIWLQYKWSMHTVYIKTFVIILQEITPLKYPPKRDHPLITDQIFGQQLLGVYSMLCFWHFRC